MSSDPLISQMIGQYEIVARIGKGGMSTVYRARQRNMQRDVAIKIISADLAEDPQFMARFEREAQVIANLQHPRILPVHDFGHEGDTAYLVMRLIEGESLYQRLRRGPLLLQQASKYVDQIAEALDYAHAQGVVHRDLKPNNILIDEWDNLYLMDFGLAKIIAASQSLTQTGAVLGTPAYMAPEQWRGEPVDGRTDVYALGVILYEMVVGHTPFESDTPFTLMYKHINDAPPSPRETLPDLPVEVEAVILKALAKQKEDRYQSAGDLARDFGSVARVAGSLAQRRVPVSTPPVAAEVAPAAESPVEGAAEVAAEVVPNGTPEGAPDGVLDSAPDAPAALDESVPPPARITPPPPPIPVPGGSVPVSGVPDSAWQPDPDAARAARRKAKEPFGSPETVEPGGAASALRQAFEAVDRSLEVAVEHVAEAIPTHDSGRVSFDGQLPVNSRAFADMRSTLPVNEPLIGVVDVRGTTQWKQWKQMVIGGLLFNVLGGVLHAGVLSLLGWVAWLYLIVHIVRIWRGNAGLYYLGFTPDRVLLLPRDRDGAFSSAGAYAAVWGAIERLRLTDRYVLLDMPGDGDVTLHLAGMLPASADGGLGDQVSWLAGSPITALIEQQGFEVRNL